MARWADGPVRGYGARFRRSKTVTGAGIGWFLGQAQVDLALHAVEDGRVSAQKGREILGVHGESPHGARRNDGSRTDAYLQCCAFADELARAAVGDGPFFPVIVDADLRLPFPDDEDVVRGFPFLHQPRAARERALIGARHELTLLRPAQTIPETDAGTRMRWGCSRQFRLTPPIRRFLRRERSTEVARLAPKRPPQPGPPVAPAAAAGLATLGRAGSDTGGIVPGTIGPVTLHAEVEPPGSITERQCHAAGGGRVSGGIGMRHWPGLFVACSLRRIGRHCGMPFSDRDT